ncbi:MAG: hypothetical protein LBK23_05255 [Oscillospiraceae bacterium]|jgi:REP element-mobilizing transposase RayT|nr:hypothetical protein [Oscillospiraceae bacterium]
MDDMPKRKPNRMAGYNYSQNGAYFITICAKNRAEIFSRIVPVGATAPGRPRVPVPTVQLTPLGQCVDDTIQMQNKNGVTIDRYVIMPDHIHAVVFIAVETGECDGRKNGDAGDRGRSPLQGVVRNVKSFVTKLAGFSPWQKSFYDHIIRNEIEYVQIIKYIEDNPAKWIAGETEETIQWLQ